VLARDSAATDSLSAKLMRITTDGYQRDGARFIRMAVLGTPEQTREAIQGLSTQSDPFVLDAARNSIVYLRDVALGRSAAEILTARDRTTEFRVMAFELLGDISLASGGWSDALPEYQRAIALDSVAGLEHAAYMMAAANAHAPPPAVMQMRQRLLAIRSSGAAMAHTQFDMPNDRLHALLRQFIAGMLDLRLDDTTAAADQAHRLLMSDCRAYEYSPCVAWSAALRAQIAAGRGQWTYALSLLDTARLRLPLDQLGSYFGAQPYARLLHGLVLAKLGRTREALGWYSSIGEALQFDVGFIPAARRGAATARQLQARAEPTPATREPAEHAHRQTAPRQAG
jgi:tetratricopeptide (TPR) repeat protein